MMKNNIFMFEVNMEGKVVWTLRFASITATWMSSTGTITKPKTYYRSKALRASVDIHAVILCIFFSFSFTSCIAILAKCLWLVANVATVYVN